MIMSSKKLLTGALLAAILTAFIPIKVLASDYPDNIVSTDHQTYSYAEMMEDISMLCGKYPGILSRGSVGLSSYGRDIPVIIIGNPDASKKVMIQATIHAREYMCTQFVMGTVEYICKNYYSANVNGTGYSELFSNVCFHVVPMVNPDGVEIAQRGCDGAKNEDTKNWIRSQEAAGFTQAKIKSNANGVDLNRNFPTGFGMGKKKSATPCFEYYCGETPLNQSESSALASYSSKGFYAFINYHSSGNIIYYGTPINSAENASRSQALASVLHGYNSYRLIYDDESGTGYGSFGDYVQAAFDRPSATVEIGTANPVPISQYGGIFKSNRDSWGGVAYAIYTCQF